MEMGTGVIAPAPVSSRVMVEPVGDSGVVVAAVKDSGVDVTMVETSVLLWLHTKKTVAVGDSNVAVEQVGFSDRSSW